MIFTEAELYGHQILQFCKMIGGTVEDAPGFTSDVERQTAVCSVLYLVVWPNQTSQAKLKLGYQRTSKICIANV